MRYIPALLLIAVLLVPCLAAIAEDLHKPQLYDHNGMAVDPLCFLSNIGTEDAPVYPTAHCVGPEISGIGESVLDEARFVSSGYRSAIYDEDAGETFSYHGFIGYRAIGQVEYEGGNYLAMVLIENGGGSGIFSTIMLVHPTINPDDQTMTFRLIATLSSGDRCMGGYADAWVDDGDLYYRVETTMADMMTYTGDPQRDILDSDAAKSLPYCASCCYAQAEYSAEEFRGMFFPQDRSQPSTYSSEAEICVENLVQAKTAGGEQAYLGAEDFGFFTDEIERICLGREGKGE
ncbi:MAG: hypothetical protein GW778_04830 [Alphaproteobacteria bacterium]|nr:hypothetical protein [Alphaproteobacteria bacterium]